jgi:hypothetical protein
VPWRHSGSPFVRQIVISKLRLQAELDGRFSCGLWKPAYGFER